MVGDRSAMLLGLSAPNTRPSLAVLGPAVNCSPLILTALSGG